MTWEVTIANSIVDDDQWQLITSFGLRVKFMVPLNGRFVLGDAFQLVSVSRELYPRVATLNGAWPCKL